MSLIMLKQNKNDICSGVVSSLMSRFVKMINLWPNWL